MPKNKFEKANEYGIDIQKSSLSTARKLMIVRHISGPKNNNMMQNFIRQSFKI